MGGYIGLQEGLLVVRGKGCGLPAIDMDDQEETDDQVLEEVHLKLIKVRDLQSTLTRCICLSC